MERRCFLFCRLSFWQPAAALLLGLLSANVTAQPARTYADNPAVVQYIAEVTQKHGFDPGKLTALFAQTAFKPDIIAAITRPAEAKPWFEYRKIFITPDRIKGGAAFMRQHAAALKKAQQSYGVPPEIITAIIGVETGYGKNQGRYRVIDALSTLAFDYPPRAPFFREELTQFLLLAQEENVDPLALGGSYAGAMGQPQFMPSSFRRYAVDFDADQRRNLWTDTVDVIGSVGNYFAVHGWLADKPIARKAQLKNNNVQDLVATGYKPNYTIKQFSARGVTIPGGFKPDIEAALIALALAEGKSEHWLGLANFYVITRYNHSALYAMAVYQLSEEIKRAATSKAPKTATTPPPKAKVATPKNNPKVANKPTTKTPPATK